MMWEELLCVGNSRAGQYREGQDCGAEDRGIGQAGPTVRGSSAPAEVCYCVLGQWGAVYEFQWEGGALPCAVQDGSSECCLEHKLEGGIRPESWEQPGGCLEGPGREAFGPVATVGQRAEGNP